MRANMLSAKEELINTRTPNQSCLYVRQFHSPRKREREREMREERERELVQHFETKNTIL